MKPPDTSLVRPVVWEDGEGNLPSYPIALISAHE
jgi:hypothetical protein